MQGHQHAACRSLTDLPALIVQHIIAELSKASRLQTFRTCKQLRDAVLDYASAAGLRTRLYLTTDVKPLVMPGHAQSASAACSSQASIVNNMLRYTASKAVQEFMQLEWTALQDERDVQHASSNSLRNNDSEAAQNEAATPGLAAASASKLLRLTARSTHQLHLHVCSSYDLQAALHHGIGSDRSSSRYLHNNSSGSSQSVPDSSNTVGCTLEFVTDLEWLATFMVAAPTLSLQHITSIWLKDMMLDHPMPACIGDSCPHLQCYGIQNVAWPETQVTRCWPQVKQLTIHDVYTFQLTRMFNSDTLPQLSKLRFVWSDTHGAFDNEFGLVLGLCWRNFQEQLLSLKLSGPPLIPLSLLRDWVVQCDKLTSLVGLKLVWPDVFFKKVAQYAPHIQELRVGVLCLERCLPWDGFKWERLQHLQIDAFLGDVMRTLSSFPPMPKIQTITLPGSLEVLVGTDWIADVAGVLGLQVPPSDH